MHDFMNLILAELRGAWRFRWFALAVAWVVAVVGALVILAMPDEYQVRARVHVDTDTVLGPLLEGVAVSSNLGARVQMISNTILNRDNLEKIARRSDMSLTVRTPIEEQALIQRLGNSISVSGTEEDLYTITYTSEEPRTAHLVVQSVLDILMEETLGSNRADSSSATQFLQRQVDDYEQRLQAAEARLAQFKRENVGLLPSQGGRDYYQRLRQSEEQLEAMERDLRTAQSQRASIEADLEAMRSGEGIDGQNNPHLAELDERIRQSQRQLTELRLRYTDSHPDVISMRSQIERQRAERERVAGQPGQADPGELQTNPVYQQLQMNVNELNAQIAAMRPRIEEERQSIGALLGSVDEITAVETRLSDLTRTYDSTRSRYQALLARLNTAELSSDAESSGGQVQFRMVDPPVTPAGPSGPPRVLYLLALLPVGLGAGGGAAFILHQLRPVFQSRRSLAEWTGRPVLGAVSRVMTLAQRRRQRGEVMAFGAATLVLILVVVLGTLVVNSGADQLQSVVGSI